MVITITVDAKAALKSLNKLPISATTEMQVAIHNFGGDLQKSVLRSATQAGIQPFSSNGMFSRTRWVSKLQGGYLVMPMEGIWQDSAATHRVYVWKKSKPMLKAWAQRYWGRANGSFMFKSKPFIQRGLQNALSRMPSKIREAVRKSIKDRLR